MQIRFLLPWAGAAFWLCAASQAETPQVQAHYAGYYDGLNVFDVDLSASMEKAAYRMQISFRLTGLVGALYHANGTTVVDGRFDGGKALPRALISQGQIGGSPHALKIGWPDGSPKVLEMVPPAEEAREPVSETDRAHTVDVLSAVALLLHQVNDTGACENATRTFDGVRLSEFTARTIGPDTLPQTDRSSFQGQALRCEVNGRMIGGFMRDSDRPALHKPRKGVVWFARAQPGSPLIPVRIQFFDTDGDPTATMYLKAPP